MMRFWSDIGLYLQIALVVGGVVLLALFDPFGIFGSKKQTLEDTPISVRSIREIGQLISAEYYGEVLTSLQEAIIEEIRESKVDDASEFEEIQTRYEEALRDFYDKRKSVRLGIINRGNRLYDLFYDDYPILTGDPYFQDFIEVVLEEVDYKNERRLLKDLVKMSDEEVEALAASVQDIDTRKFVERHNKAQEVFMANKRLRKSQIVVLGRGSVKAGIDFGKFDEDNFRYDRQNKTIHLIGMQPEILTSDINPWFIPEKKVKGFEIIVMNRKASRPDYMLKVKQMALRKLKQNAIQAGIVRQAKKNAENALKSFFTLLVPEGIDNVVIYDSYLSYFDESFVNDSITTDVMRSIDSLFVSRFKADSIEVVNLKDGLKNRKIFMSNGKSYPINRYSAHLQIAEDEVLSDQEFQWLKAEPLAIESLIDSLEDDNTTVSRLRYNKIPDRLDSIWNFPTRQEMKAYRDEIDKIYYEEFKWYEVISNAPEYVRYMQVKDTALQRRVLTHLLRERLFDFEEFSAVVKENVSHVVKGDITFSVDSVIKESKKLDDQGHEVRFVSDLDDQLQVLGETMDQLLDYDSVNISLEELISANERVDRHWAIERKEVDTLLYKMKNQWRLVIGGDTSRIQRYSEWYQYLSGDTLSAEFTPMFQRAVKDDKEKMKWLKEEKLKNLNLAEVKRANSDLDIAWFYPSQEKLNEFKEQVERTNHFGVSDGTKEKLRQVEMESKIQRHVLKEKEAARKAMFDVIMQQTRFIKTVDGNVLRNSAVSTPATAP